MALLHYEQVFYHSSTVKTQPSSASGQARESRESEEQEVTDPDLLTHDHEDEIILPRVQSLADAEKLFDELTQEKQQVSLEFVFPSFLTSFVLCNQKSLSLPPPLSVLR